MRTTIFGLAATVLLMLIGSFPVNAAFFTISPQGSIPVSGIGQTVSFDLKLETQNDSFQYNFWDFDFVYDSAELTFTGATYAGGMDAFNVTDDFSGGLQLSAGLPLSAPDLVAAANATIDIAMISFTVSSLTSWDGNADFLLLSQIGTSGLAVRGFIDASSDVHQFAGTEGGDVGSPVPLPASVWLFGSGVIGLAGVRKLNL